MEDNSKALEVAQERIRKALAKPVPKLSPNGKVKQFLAHSNAKGVVLCDFSGSMRGEKHDKMTNALNLLIPKYPFFTIIAYGGDGEVAEVDIATLTSLVPTGRTPMKAAFQKSYDYDPTAIILVTDGMPTDGSSQEITDLAVAKGIPVYSVGVKEASGYCEYNELFLKEIAERTGGAFMPADSPLEIGAALGNAFQVIEYKGTISSSVVKL